MNLTIQYTLIDSSSFPNIKPFSHSDHCTGKEEID
jgi:hypothetical protein